MTRTDHQILYTTLVYIAIYLKESTDADKAEPASLLARHIEDYCRRNIKNIFAPVNVHFVNDGDVTEIDQAIEKHVNQLRSEESTILPEDKPTLLKFYGRLQQRKARRMQVAFYEMANAGMLANAVLKYLDEEIEAGGE